LEQIPQLGPIRSEIHIGLFNVAGQAASFFTDYAGLDVNDLDVCRWLVMGFIEDFS
jgi:hypothetical protein